MLTCVGGVLTLSAPATAASPAEVKLIVDAVRARYPDINGFCKLPEADRPQVVIKETMALASTRKLSDPFGAGPVAGAELRAICGRDPGTLPGEALRPAEALRWRVTSPPLRFEPGRNSLGMFTGPASLANRVFAPEGHGPFPAVVIGQTKSISAHLLVHAKSLIEAGYAVLVVDTYGPRGYKIGVNEPLPAEFAKDAYDALAHLQTQDYVDRDRIYQTGFSNGGVAAALLASPEGAKAFNAAGRFRATVSHYGSCKVAAPYSGANAAATYMEMLSADSDRPILMLMGELDIETPPSTCFPLLAEMKAAGKPVEWHIYPKTTHGWDKAEHNGYVYRTTTGETMAYRYDAEVTRDATRRTIDFFARHR